MADAITGAMAAPSPRCLRHAHVIARFRGSPGQPWRAWVRAHQPDPHHAVDLNVPIGCGGVAVYPGDIVVGDGEGVVAIPAHVADEVAQEAHEMTAFEDFVMERVLGGQTIVGLYPPTDERTPTAFQEWRRKNGR